MIYNILLLSAFYGAASAISCLVMRPGYGLVSEKCPSMAVGCRIKVDKSHIQWYEYAKLYDRNQLVCVLPGEYKQESGCHKKPSGSTRCWCGARDDCNDPETSRELYREFEHGGNSAVRIWQEKQKKKYMEAELEEFEEADSNDIDEIVTRPPTKTTTTTTTTERTTTTTSTSTTSKKHHKHHYHHKVTKNSSPKTTTETMTTTSRSVFEEKLEQIEKEMKEEDDRLNMILQDEERELMKDAEEREEERRDQAEASRIQAAEEKRKNSSSRTEKPSDAERNDRKQRRRDEEKLRQQEEERLAVLERKEAEERERRAKEREQEEEALGEQKIDDYLDGVGSFGLAPSERNLSSFVCTVTTLIVVLSVGLFNF